MVMYSRFVVTFMVFMLLLGSFAVADGLLADAKDWQGDGAGIASITGNSILDLFSTRREVPPSAAGDIAQLPPQLPPSVADDLIQLPDDCNQEMWEREQELLALEAEGLLDDRSELSAIERYDPQPCECIPSPELDKFLYGLELHAAGQLTDHVDIERYNAFEYKRIPIVICPDCEDPYYQELFEVLNKINDDPLLPLTSMQMEIRRELKIAFEECNCKDSPYLRDYVNLLQLQRLGQITQEEENRLNGYELRLGVEICPNCEDAIYVALYDLLQEINEDPSTSLNGLQRDLYKQLYYVFEECECDDTMWDRYQKLLYLESEGLLEDRSELTQLERYNLEPCDPCDDTQWREYKRLQALDALGMLQDRTPLTQLERYELEPCDPCEEMLDELWQENVLLKRKVAILSGTARDSFTSRISSIFRREA